MEWEMSEKQSARFLKRAESEGDIVWERGKGAFSSALKTPKKQSKSVGRSVGHDVGRSVGFLNKENEKNKEKEPPMPPHGGKPHKLAHAPKTEEAIKKCLDAVNLENFRLVYAKQGLDVDLCWKRFCEYVMFGNASKPFSNPSNYRDMGLAFHNSCKGAIDKGMFQLKTSIDPNEPPGRPGPGYWFDKAINKWIPPQDNNR
jgi:hypothetical protein